MHPTISKAIESMTADELAGEIKAEQDAADSLARRLGYWLLREWENGGIGKAIGDFRYAPYKQPPLTAERIKEMGEAVDRLSHEMNRSTSNEIYRARRTSAMRERLKKIRPDIPPARAAAADATQEAGDE